MSRDPSLGPRRHTVFVADDHPVVRAGVRLLLGRSRLFALAGEAETGRQAILQCARLRPDLVLLDLRLPDMPAASVCRRIRAHRPETVVVILTAYEEEAALRGCLKAGAAGCLLKDMAEHPLLAALRQAVNGRTVIDPRLAGALPPGGEGPGLGSRLSVRERDVLVQIARGLTTAEIAVVLGLSPNTVKSHTRRLFAELGARNRIQALSVARARGLL